MPSQTDTNLKFPNVLAVHKTHKSISSPLEITITSNLLPSTVIKKHGGSVLMVDESTIDTNLLYATVDDQVITALKFVERLEKVYFLIRIIE